MHSVDTWIASWTLDSFLFPSDFVFERMAVPHYEGKQRVVWMSSAQHSTLLIPEQVLDILLSIHSVPPGQLRHDPIPEKPPCGALFAVLKSPEEPLENDGHDWVDRAAVYTIAVREYVSQH